VHAVPIPCSEQVVPLQTLGAVQSVVEVATVQVFLQIWLVASQAKAPQEVGAAGVQVPVPLQSEAGVWVEPVQVAAAHWVPAAYFWQAAAPLQNPLLPQVGAVASAH
jgi:hypothetical protein